MEGPVTPGDAVLSGAVESSEGKSAQASERRITAQDAEQAKRESEAAFSQLMDDMENSVPEQGEYFVKLGQKEMKDSRVLILNNLEPNRDDFTIEKRLLVTREGVLELKLLEDSNTIGIRLSEIVKGLMSGKAPDQAAGLYDDGDAIRFALEGDRGLDMKIGAVGLTRFRGTTEDFQESIKKSIQMTEAPHIKVVEDTRVQTELAQSASSMIKALPPRE